MSIHVRDPQHSVYIVNLTFILCIINVLRNFDIYIAIQPRDVY